MTDEKQCRSWRCFIQDNFTALALFAFVLIALVMLLTLMHEDKIDDKYVTWFEGFVSGAFAVWNLALRIAASQHQNDSVKISNSTVTTAPATPDKDTPNV